MAKIYTKTGDTGETGLFAGPRVRKSDARIEAYGTVDELNTILGMARAEGLADEVDALLHRVQSELFAVGAELATPDAAAAGTDYIGETHVAALEADIDRFEADLPSLDQFILPSGAKAATLLHFARTVCRRAERRVVALVDLPQTNHPQITVSVRIVSYLNRLSDLIFVLARHANLAAGRGDVPWQKPDRP